MKSLAPSLNLGRLAAPGLALVLTLLTGTPASAQNFVKNPDFEEALGTNNWSVVYVAPSSEADFMVHGRSTIAHKDKVPGTWDGTPFYWNKYGAHLRPYTDGLMEAYFSQTISNLTPGASYNVSCWAVHFNQTFIVAPIKVRAWIESIGGNGSVSSSDVSGYNNNNPAVNAGWAQYAANNTADANGKIELRLHFKKTGFTSNQKWPDIDVFFDHAAVMPAAQPNFLPPYSLTSLTRSNQNVTLTWQTVLNNSYRLQVATDPDFTQPLTWSTFQRDPYQDPDLLATGTNFTFTMDMLANDPAYDPTVPRFFRVSTKTYTP